jgi:N-acetylglucosaminyldiphosphoundecaprenol N-acetyl-beta-D-mannosaminyltransferase
VETLARGGFRRIHVAGLPIAVADVQATVESLTADAKAAVPHAYVFVNGHSATLRRDSAYAGVLRSPEVIPVPDGVPLAIGAFLTGQGRIHRCPGPDLFQASAARAASEGMSFYLLGGGVGVADELAKQLTRCYPGLRIAGLDVPPFGDWSDEDGVAMADAARASGADIVWVGVSAPKQEIWAARWASRIGRPVVCVGAAFDFLSGRKRRAPRWLRALGLEWLFRFSSEPGRMWRRYAIGNCVFIRDLIRNWDRAGD